MSKKSSDFLPILSDVPILLCFTTDKIEHRLVSLVSIVLVLLKRHALPFFFGQRSQVYSVLNRFVAPMRSVHKCEQQSASAVVINMRIAIDEVRLAAVLFEQVYIKHRITPQVIEHKTMITLLTQDVKRTIVVIW
jgi:hypothetical protein